MRASGGFSMLYLLFLPALRCPRTAIRTSVGANTPEKFARLSRIRRVLAVAPQGQQPERSRQDGHGMEGKQ